MPRINVAAANPHISPTTPPPKAMAIVFLPVPASEKDLYKDTEKLQQLGFTITLHDKMPDIVLYREDKDWLYFIEAVTSVGFIDAKRIMEIETMTKNVSSGKIYVTSFLDFKTFKKFSESLAWETEVWIADMPEHMIHLDGDRFLEPR